MLTDGPVQPHVLFVIQYVEMSIARAQTSGDAGSLDRLYRLIKSDRHLTLNQIYRLLKPQTAVIRRIFAVIPAAIMDKSPAQIEDLFDPQFESQVRTLSDVGSEAALGFPIETFRVLRVIVPSFQSDAPQSTHQIQDSPSVSSAHPSAQTPRPVKGTLRRVAPIMQTAEARWPPKGVIRGRIDLGTTASATPTVTVNPFRPRRLHYQHRLPSKAMTKGSIRRLARRGGVKRISGGCYVDARDALQQFLRNVLESVVNYTDYANRKTVTVQDVMLGLKKQGQTLYL